jgi:hypothetical protein
LFGRNHKMEIGVANNYTLRLIVKECLNAVLLCLSELINSLSQINIIY